MNTNAHPSGAPGARIFNPQHVPLPECIQTRTLSDRKNPPHPGPLPIRCGEGEAPSPLRSATPRPARTGARACCPQHATSSVSVGRRQFVNRDDVNGADGHGQLVVINHHNRLGRHGNEVTVRNFKAPAIGETKRKGDKSVFEPFLDLINHFATLLRAMVAGKTPDCPTRAVQGVFTKAGKWLLCNQSANENVRSSHGAEKFFNLVCLEALSVTESNGWPSS